MKYYLFRNEGKNIPLYYYVTIETRPLGDSTKRHFERLRAPSGETVPDSRFWDSKEQKIKVPATGIGTEDKVLEKYISLGELEAEIDETNMRLLKLERVINSKLKSLKDKNITNKKDQLKKAISRHIEGDGGPTEEIDLFGAIENFIEFQEVHEDYAVRTMQDYRRSLQLLREFNKNLDFQDITRSFYVRYMKFMKEVKGFAPNTQGKHIKILKTFMEDARVNGYHSNVFYQSKSFKTVKKDVSNDYASEQEMRDLSEAALEMFQAKKLDEKELSHFLWWGIMAESGQRAGDVLLWDQDNVYTDQDEQTWLEFIESKSGSDKSLLVSEGMAELLFPPHPSTQAKVNAVMRKVVEAARLDKDLTCHSGRRSKISNMALAGYTIEEIMLVSGHKTEKICRNYMQAGGKDLAKALAGKRKGNYKPVKQIWGQLEKELKGHELQK